MNLAQYDFFAQKSHKSKFIIHQAHFMSRLRFKEEMSYSLKTQETIEKGLLF